jgi:hypothetical protein
LPRFIENQLQVVMRRLRQEAEQRIGDRHHHLKSVTSEAPPEDFDQQRKQAAILDDAEMEALLAEEFTRGVNFACDTVAAEVLQEPVEANANVQPLPRGR